MQDKKEKSTFYYYGITCDVCSSDSLFLQIINTKFGGFKDKLTQQLMEGKVSIFVNDVDFQKSEAGTMLSDKATILDSSLLVKHRYLSTETVVVFKFYKNTLKEIYLDINTPLLFELLNLFSGKKLKRQLYQILIKLYIEQTLLWHIATEKELKCLHAASIEKEGKVYVFCGLNGVGKTTLAQFLIKKHGFKFFSDNYILVDQKYAYFSPDAVRLDSKGLELLGKTKSSYFGFGKDIFRNKPTEISKLKKAKMEAVYLVYKASGWEKDEVSKDKQVRKIRHLQIVNEEEVEFAKISQYQVPKEMLDLTGYPDCKYFELKMGSINQLTKSIL